MKDFRICGCWWEGSKKGLWVWRVFMGGMWWGERVKCNMWRLWLMGWGLRELGIIMESDIYGGGRGVGWGR